MEQKIICFHNPDEENGFLSNWYMSDFVVDGVKFSSAEQYMMYSKAVLFGDADTAKKIMSISDVGKIKALGREVTNYSDAVWNGMRQLTVAKGLKAKFTQNDDLRKKLLDTGKDVLAECAVRDMIWGIGLSMKDENRFNMFKWKGENLLGFSLMFVRDIISGEL